MSNHRSNWDPIIIAFITPRFVHFMAKEELFGTPCKRLLLKSVLAFPVKRKSADLQSVRKAMKVLKSGKLLGIFPEGKRAVTDDIDEFEKGAAFMAVHARVPVVPIYIPPNNYRLFKRITVIAGTPIDIKSTIANLPKSTMVDVIADKLTDAICALKSQYEAGL